MKNLTKIFMAFVAVMLVSCITDTTTEPTVELGKVKTTIDLSFEGVKTHLGDKSDNQYPLLWSAGDQIAINGYISEPLAEEFDGKAAASFDIESDSELTYPRSIVYPAPAEGTGVTFPAVQAYEAGNIADGVAPLYGYAEEGEAITLKHLTGILRFAVAGEATLASMTVKAEGGAIAGSFDVDFATGALTAQDGKTSDQITMSFGDGLALGAEATPLYIAVPAGAHGIYTITLVTIDNQAMTLSFNSDEKPIKAGIVREFKEFVFKTISGELPEGELIIDSEADLLNLSMWSKAGQLNKVTSVKVGANIDMSKATADWQPIEGFPAITFDGGNDQGYAISGLKAPLFIALNGATIKNVKLADVAIEETTRNHFGALACDMTGGSLTNCEVTGAITYNNGVHVGAEAEKGLTTVINVGCMVGSMVDVAEISNCINRATMTIARPLKETSVASDAQFGGLFGAIHNTASNTTPYDTLKNYGDIEYNNATHTYANTIRPFVGGICGNPNLANFSNVYAEGDITFSTSVYCIMVGGLFGITTDCNVTTGESHGDVSVNNRCVYPYYGGCIGVLGASTLKQQCTVNGVINYGAVKTENKPYFTKNVFIGGVVGTTNAGNYVTLKNCSNKGIVDIALGDVKGDKVDAFYIGGIVGQSKLTYNIENCVNGVTGTEDPNYSADGTIKKGSITISVQTSESGEFCIGGIAAFGSTTIDITGCHNYAPITVTTKDADDAANAFIGGVFGYGNHKCVNCTNGADATITFDGSGTTSFTYVYMGGIGGQNKNGGLDNVTNYGDVVFVNASSTTVMYVGGIVGSSAYAFTNATNYGTVKSLEGAQSKNIALTGIAAHISADGCANLINHGTLSYKGSGAAAYLAGVIGTTINTKNLTGDNFVNTGALYFEGAQSKTCYIGGVVGHGGGAGVIFTNMINTGNITVTKAPASTYVGGIKGYSVTSLDGSKVYCDIFAKDCTYVGIVTGRPRVVEETVTNYATNCQVGGRIAKTESEKKTWDDDAEDYIVAVTPDWNSISNDNFFSYIYGSADWAGVENYDGCSWLSEKPSVSAQ